MHCFICKKFAFPPNCELFGRVRAWETLRSRHGLSPARRRSLAAAAPAVQNARVLVRRLEAKDDALNLPTRSEGKLLATFPSRPRLPGTPAELRSRFL